MFNMLVIGAAKATAELDAADGYASIYNDATQKLASFSIPKTGRVTAGAHAADHGNTFNPNASFYLNTSSHLAVQRTHTGDGYKVVDARSASGCHDNFRGYGCSSNDSR